MTLGEGGNSLMYLNLQSIDNDFSIKLLCGLGGRGGVSCLVVSSTKPRPVIPHLNFTAKCNLEFRAYMWILGRSKRHAPYIT